jgi:DNA-binding NarL/FixJ family response regulator
VRVLIVEDHPVVARALAAFLAADREIAVVGQARTVAGAIDSSRRTAPDVVLMDFRLPDGTGAQASAAIRCHDRPPAIVFLTADISEEVRRLAAESGACCVLPKAAGAGEIPRAVRRAAAEAKRLSDS